MFQNTVRQSTCSRIQDTAEISTAALLSYFPSLSEKYNMKVSHLVIYKILGLFANILTANHMYPLCNRENLPQSIQMQLYKKQKTLSQLFAIFMKSTSNLEHFVKKYDPRSFCVSEIMDWERST